MRRGERRREVELADRRGRLRRARFEHPAAVRWAHWLVTLAVPILVLSGLQIFRAFPSFGPKVGQENFLDVPRAFTLGGWLAGGIQWHFTFAWVFLGAGALYAAYQLATGNWRQIVPSRRDLAGVVPMLRHYLRGAPEPEYPGAYNPLQKLAYTGVLAAGALAAISGLALWRPVQLSWVVVALGGFQGVRIAHFLAMAVLVAFVPVHLVLVAFAGWGNFRSMWTGFDLEEKASRSASPVESREGRKGP